MLKHTICFMLCTMLLAGCATSKTSSDVKLELYETYYNAISDNISFAADSDYYSVSYEMIQLADGSYRYYVFFDEPKIAMYDIVILGVEDEIPYAKAEKMMPSIGIFDSHYAMIPYQVNSSEGFVKGLAISGESEMPFLQLKTLVEWKDISGKNVEREYLLLMLNMDQDPQEGAENNEDEDVSADEEVSQE